MSRYYPDRYYSFEEPEAFRKIGGDNPVARFLRNRRSAYLFEGADMIGRFVSKIYPAQPKLLQYVKLFKNCHARLDSRILDVGSGQGKVLSELAWYGFTDLTGVDRYIESDVRSGNVAILRRDIFSLDGTYDVIMFNHSFEHMDDPFAVLSKTGELLCDNGRVMIRIPTVSSYAWEHYGVNWVGLDAPRHLFLYSLKSMEILAQKAGFAIRAVLYDSTNFQIWGSEQYINDIPLRDERSYFENPGKSIFTDAQIKQFDRLIEELNRDKRGDTVCVFLNKI
ncbi:MAG: class I SAM-dependent methyltransferase [Candidatus Omnitrophota bacterium]